MKKKHSSLQPPPAPSQNAKSSINKTWIGLGIILVLGLMLRIVFLLQAFDSPLFHGYVADTDYYDSLALQYLNGMWLIKDSIFLNPLYPVFLWFVYLFAGHSLHAVAFVQAMLDTGTIFMIFILARRIAGKGAAFCSSAMYAIYGPAIFYTGILLAPAIVVFFLVLSFVFIVRQSDKGRLATTFFSGMSLGTAALGLPSMGLLIIPIAFQASSGLRRKNTIHRLLISLLLLAAGFGITQAPVALRNYRIQGKFTASSLGGMNFYIGNNPASTGYFVNLPGISTLPIEQAKSAVALAEKRTGRTLSPSQASHYWFMQGVGFLAGRPLAAAKLYVMKLFLFWRSEEVCPNASYNLCRNFVPFLRLPFISFGLLAPLCLAGIFFMLRRKSRMVLVPFVIATITIAVILFFVTARYRVSVVPFCAVAAGLFLSSMADLIKNKRYRKALIPILVFAVAAVFFNIKMGRALPITFPDEELTGVGISYLQQNRFAEAEALFKKVLVMNPHNLQALKDLGDTYLKIAEKGDSAALEPALDCYQKAVTARPGDIEARTELANIKSRMNDLEGAITEFHNILQLDANSVDAMIGLGFECMAKKDVGAAIEWFNKAISINPKNQEAWFNLGVADDKIGAFAESENAYRKALDQDSLSELSRKIRLNLGISLARQERWTEALAVCQRLVDLYPDYEKAQNNLQAFKQKAAEQKTAKP